MVGCADLGSCPHRVHVRDEGCCSRAGTSPACPGSGSESLWLSLARAPGAQGEPVLPSRPGQQRHTAGAAPGEPGEREPCWHSPPCCSRLFALDGTSGSGVCPAPRLLPLLLLQQQRDRGKPACLQLQWCLYLVPPVPCSPGHSTLHLPNPQPGWLD